MGFSLDDHMAKPLKTPAWLTKEVWGWAAFDFANQAFTMVIITALYQQYFIRQVVPVVGDSNERGRQFWEWSNITAEVIIIVLSPLLGALADFSGAKKKFLFVTYLGCVLCTFGLGFVDPGEIAMGVSLFVAGYVFFAAGENFLNAFLPEISRQKDMGRVSAFSWAIAYTGSLISVIVAYAIMAGTESSQRYQWVAFWCAGYFLIAGIPTFILLKERKLKEALPPNETVFTVGFHRLRQTLRDVRQYRQLLRYLAIVMIYTAGVQVVIFFAGMIASDVFGFKSDKQGIFFAIIIITGIIGAIVTGNVQDRIGTRSTIQALLLLWVFTMLLGAFATQEWLFWVAGNLVGFGMGSLFTASRVLAGLFSPHHKSAEFFGLYGMAQKSAAILGLGSQSLLRMLGADFNVAIGASAIFFVIGFLLMFTVNEREGRVVAIKSAREHVRAHNDYAGSIEGDVT